MSSFRDTFGGQNDLPGFSAEHDSFDVMPTPTTSTPNDAFLPESEETSFKSMTWPQAGGLGHPYRLPYNDGAYPAGDQRRENTMAFFATQAPHAYGSAASELAGSSGFLPDGDAYHRHALARGPCDALNAPQPAVSPFAPWHLHNPTFESSFLSTEAPNIFARNSFASAIATASQGWGSYAYGKGGFGGVTAPEAAIRDGGVSSSGRVLTGDRPRDHVGGDTYGSVRRSTAYRTDSPPTRVTAAAVPIASAAPSSVGDTHRAFPCADRRQVAPIIIPPVPPMLHPFTPLASPTKAGLAAAPTMYDSFARDHHDSSGSSTLRPQTLRRESSTRSSPASSTSSSPTSVTFSSPATSLSGSAGTAAERKAHRKSRRDAAQALNIGIVPSNPESLSSHEKKRYYLESLEQYVIYLHEQLKLVGTDPVPLERVSTYRGLSSRSIRTLLVHMRNGVGKLSLRTESEEKKFIERRDAVYSQDLEPRALHEYERHFGIATANKVTHMGEPLGSSLGSLGIAAAKGESWQVSASNEASAMSDIMKDTGGEKDTGAVLLQDAEDAVVLESPRDGSKK